MAPKIDKQVAPNTDKQKPMEGTKHDKAQI